jgi:glycosyltransferase involved in cell wall biosynthesis
VLVFGYKYFTQTQLILSSRWPLVFRGDSHLIDHPRPRGPKRWILRTLYRRFAAFTYVGQANREYFRAFGVPDERLFFAPHAVDASQFSPSATAQDEARRLRTELNLGDRRVVLFAGKLLPAKQPQELLEAYLALAPRNAALVFVGDGPLRETLRAIAARHPDLPVLFLPFANQSEMPARYLLADLFALPSRGLAETWGLAVNEAMHLGRPCLVSNRVGCQLDLVIDGETGWVFDAGDADALRASLARALDEFERRGRHMGQAAAHRVARYSYDAATAGLHAAVAVAAKTRHCG